MNNIELFNIYAGKVLAHYFAHFPTPAAVVTAAIVEEMRPLTNAPANTDPGWKQHNQLCSDTLNWLYDTGYLLRRGENPPKFVLSPKALEALNANLEALGPKQTLGEKLTDATKDVANEAKSKAIGEIVGQVIGATFRTFTT